MDRKLGFAGVVVAPNGWLGALDVAEDEEESPNGYADRLVVSGGKGASSSTLILGVSDGLSAGLEPNSPPKGFGFDASGFEPNKPPLGLGVSCVDAKGLGVAFGVDCCELNNPPPDFDVSVAVAKGLLAGGFDGCPKIDEVGAAVAKPNFEGAGVEVGVVDSGLV